MDKRLILEFAQQHEGKVVGLSKREASHSEEQPLERAQGSSPGWMGRIRGRSVSLSISGENLVSVSVSSDAASFFLGLRPRRQRGIVGLYTRLFRGAKFPEDPQFDRAYTISTNSLERMRAALSDQSVRQMLMNDDAVEYMELGKGVLMLQRCTDPLPGRGAATLERTTDMAIQLADAMERNME